MGNTAENENKPELPGDIAEEMAARLCLEKKTGGHGAGCDCRECFTRDLTRRMREAVKEEMKILFPTRRIKGLRSDRLAGRDGPTE